MLIEEYEDWWTTDEMPEELTEEVKEKKIKIYNKSYSHLDKILLANKKVV